MILQAILLIIGFVLLIKGADIFVDSSVSIAEKLRVPSLIIGLTIVSFGTSAPEAVVSVTAAVKGVGTLSVGNVVGSNVFNLLLVVGMCGLIRPFYVKLRDLLKDFCLSIGAALALLLMMVFSTDNVPRIVSVVILVVFFGYIIILIRQAQKKQLSPVLSGAGELPQPDIIAGGSISNESGAAVTASGADTHGADTHGADTPGPGAAKKEKPLWLIILLAVLGCAMIVAGGQVTVSSAVEIAAFIGVTERVVGLTIVAVGTSLPELITSVVAARKREPGIALGNAVGSNIFNIMFVLGMAGAISPLAADMNIIIDLIFLISVSLLTMLFVHTGRKFTRLEGLALVSLYAGYMVYVVVK